MIMPFGGDRAMVTIDPGARASAADVAALAPRAVAASRSSSMTGISAACPVRATL